MSVPSKAELQAEIARLNTEIDGLNKELERTTKVQSDLWSHDIYIKARNKMTAGMIAVLTVLGLIGGGALYQYGKAAVEKVSATLAEHAEQQMKKDVEANVGEAVKKLLADQREGLRASVDKAIQELLAAQKANLTASLDSEVKAMQVEVKTSIEAARRDAAVKIDQILIKAESDLIRSVEQTRKGTEQAGLASAKVEQQEILNPLATKAGCNSEQLTEAQKNMIAIKQTVRQTNDYTDNKRRLFQNIFSVVALDENREPSTGPEAKCVLEGVVRVVYKLHERWFNPSEIVSLKREDSFQFSNRVWGSTQVRADIYIRGNRDPLKRVGRFLTGNTAAVFFKPDTTDTKS